MKRQLLSFPRLNKIFRLIKLMAENCKLTFNYVFYISSLRRLHNALLTYTLIIPTDSDLIILLCLEFFENRWVDKCDITEM